jgi:hypothetical protein
MINFFIGVIFGIVVSTIGVSGLAHFMDNAIDKTKQVVQEQAK